MMILCMQAAMIDCKEPQFSSCHEHIQLDLELYLDSYRFAM